MSLRGAADVEVDQLVQEGLEHIARADAGIGGDRESELARDREAEAVGAATRAPHLELGPALGERPAGEDAQAAQALHLLVQSDLCHQVVGAGPGARSRRLNPPAAQLWHRGHQ